MQPEQEVLQRLINIQTSLQEFRTEIEAIYDSHSKRLSAIEKDVTVVKKTLFGNGSIGLVAKVTAITWLIWFVSGAVGMVIGNALSCYF